MLVLELVAQWVKDSALSLLCPGPGISLHAVGHSQKQTNKQTKKNPTKVLIMAQQKWIWLVSMSMLVRSLGLLSGLRIWCCRELWCRSQTWLRSCMLWLWRRSAAAAPIRPLAWEFPYAAGVALKKNSNSKKKKKNSSFYSYFIFYFFVFLGSHAQHMEIPMLGVELELQLLAYTTATAMQDLSQVCDLHHSSWQCQILNPQSEARDWTCNLMVTSWICFLCATMGTPKIALFKTCAYSEQRHVIEKA